MGVAFNLKKKLLNDSECGDSRKILVLPIVTQIMEKAAFTLPE